MIVALCFAQKTVMAHGAANGTLVNKQSSLKANIGNINSKNPIKFIENKNQWNSKVDYKLELNYGAIFFEKKAVTYSFYDVKDVEAIRDAKTGVAPNSNANGIIDGHAFRVSFVGANTSGNASVSALTPSDTYRNYYLGNDPQNWASEVRSFEEVNYTELYNGIDLKYYSVASPTNGPVLKYDFIVHAGSNPAQIKLRYDGLNSMSVSNDKLHLVNSINTVIEQEPYAYQMINGNEVPVDCYYKLVGNKVEFDFPSGYNPDYDLVIDPVLEFSTYTGSSSDNFGFTSTYDLDGNLYAGGIVFGVGYPTTLGAFQVNYAGVVDVGVSKFTPDGSSLIYSTYIGGLDTELPSSLVVNSNNELVIMGTTGSFDFPTAVNGFDRTFNGGSFANFPNNGATFNNGTDIFVSKLNASGTALGGSTFIGGSSNDGINHNAVSQLQFNYGDQFRGEVIVDGQDNIYVASSTLSSDFPTTPGVFQPNSSGSQDAVVFKLNPSLSSILWSSYHGGSSVDAGYSVKLDNSDNLLVSGGTISSNLNATSGAFRSSFQGGTADGYVSKINNAGTQLIRTSYIGTSAYDQTYFVETDRFNNVYLYGQTRGLYPVSAGVYSNANSKQFIQKLDSTLSTSVFSTTFGSGSTAPNLSPTAFLVDVCGYIYASGWGGNVNTSWNSQAGTTFGMPVSPGAFQSSTDGSDFYFIVFGPDASFLEYATYFGGNGSAEHVDGGTSRFDKRGAIYQAVCAGCGGNSLFPTTPGVWSNTNNSFNCNLGALKFDFEINSVTVDVSATSISGCAPLAVQFDDIENVAVNYFWDFGDGNTAAVKSPAHTFNQPGTYEVTLIGYDPTACVGVNLTDTSRVIINVYDEVLSSVNAEVCDGDSYFVGGSFQTAAGTYYDTLTTVNGCDSVVATVLSILPNSSSTQNVSICDGDSYFVGGALQNAAGYYLDTLVSSNGCDSVVTTNLSINQLYSFTVDTTICLGDPFDGAYFNSDTVLMDSLLSVDGCDSVIVTNLFVQQCCPAPILLCVDTVEIEYNQVYCGPFDLQDPDVDSQCNIVSLTNDYPGGAFPEGVTLVTWIVTDQYGQSDTCEQAVVYQPLSLLSSYTLLAEEEVYLLPTNDVQRGAVGVMNSSGNAYLQNHTLVTGPGSFVAAPVITTFPNTQVSNPIYNVANPTLPNFEVNPVPGMGADVTVSTNQTAVLTDTVYGRIRLFKGAKVIFDNPYGVVNLKEIRVNNKAAGSQTVLQFNQCTKVRVKERVDLGPKCTINPDSSNVIFYVEGSNASSQSNQPAVDIGPRAVVYADFYVPNGRFYAHPGTHVDPARYNGTFIAKWINGDPDIVWRRRADCDYDYSCSGNQNKILSTTDLENASVDFKAYPNPFEQTATIKFTASEYHEKVSLRVFDSSGKMVDLLFEGSVQAGQTNTVVFDAAKLPHGVYYTILQTEKSNYFNKLVHIK